LNNCKALQTIEESGVEDEERDHVQVLRALVKHLILEDFNLNFSGLIRIELWHGHVSKVLLQLHLLMVEEFM